MPSIAVIWGEFVLCVRLIAVAGSRLSRYGDAIAEKTAIGYAAAATVAVEHVHRVHGNG